MPEPPAGLSAADQTRVATVEHGAAASAAAHAAMPPASHAVAEARAAVTPPPAEATAAAQADVVAGLADAAPSPEIEELCAHIQELIRSKRPADQESLVKTDPAALAKEAGTSLDASVQGDAQKVQGSYDPISAPVAGTPGPDGKPIDPPPEQVASPAINAPAAVPDAVPAQNVSLGPDVAASQSQIDAAGMNTDAAKLVQTGPIAEARKAQGDLQGMAATDPAKVLADQESTRAKAGTDMAALQAKAMQALAAARTTGVSGVTGHQHGMVGSEAQMRVQAAARAQSIFDGARAQVVALLDPLATTATAQWEAGVAVLSTKFKQDLSAVEKWLEDRYGGGWGAVLKIADDVTGLPDNVVADYDAAEKTFADGVCDLIRSISSHVNGVIAACEAIIAKSRDDLDALFKSLPASLQSWAADEQGKFNQQLDGLHDQAAKTRDDFNKDLVDRASHAVQDVREQIQKLRDAAGGLVGRIASAVAEFASDPGKFILDGLLTLVGIPPADFWALVAKIKSVINDIAADPLAFADHLLQAMAKGFGQFFDNFADHMKTGLLNWLFSASSSLGVTPPKDLSLKSIITFFLEVMGISWAMVRRVLVKHLGEKNVALAEKVFRLVASLVQQGPAGIYEMIKNRLNPAVILEKVVSAAIKFMVEAVVKKVAVRIFMLFNPAGAIAQAIEAIYRVLKWIFVNAARLFRLVQTVVNGVADIVQGKIAGMANAVESALAQVIAPVIDFLADYLGFGDLPEKIHDVIGSIQAWVEEQLDAVVGWLVEQGKALLQSLGLGKDKDKKEGGDPGDLGEVMTFTVGEETHRLWIATDGGAPIVMMASDSKPASEELDEYEKLVDGLAEDKQAEPKGLIATARALIDQTQAAAATAKAAIDNPDAKPEEKQAAIAPAKAKEGELVDPLKQLINDIKAKTLGPGADTAVGDLILDKTTKKSIEKSPHRRVLEVKVLFGKRYAIWASAPNGRRTFFYDKYGTGGEGEWEIYRKDSIYQYLRDNTPNSKAESVASSVWEGSCPIYGVAGGPFSVEHIVPVAKIAMLDGVEELSLAARVELVNLAENIMGLGSTTNSSKKDQSWSNWSGLPGKPIAESLRARMIRRESEAMQALIEKITEERNSE